ncbi:TetR/AcrR family transcriptional regulator [Clostridium sediminicola]|uniref:TetR/AcrR family transcriptional regulator n=1 Tax=Clostridium sediminicola TaxID=3114879 RepID=UPI0031F1F3AA
MNKREEIITISADLFHKYGYSNVGLKKILDTANIPKGSFYHYFKSKDQLLMEVINFFVEEMFSILEQFPQTIDGLKSFFNAYFDRFESLNFTRGCPIGNFALELSDVNEGARDLMEKWANRLKEHIKKILVSEGYEIDECESIASFMVSAFEGVLLKAKIEKNKKPLDEFTKFIFDKILIKMEE